MIHPTNDRSAKKMIHPSAIVDAGARVPASCSVGPYCIIGAEVELGENCELISHVVIHGPAKIGANNRFFPFSLIGGEPQDVSFRGEKTLLEIGDNNVVRESVTLNRGTAKGGGVTRIGNHTLIMAYAHVGHDSSIGDHAMLVNAATLAGHVTVEEWAVVGALCPVHQFVRIGAHAYIGGGTTITQDVLPFAKVSARRDVGTFGMNSIGLERRGFSKERVQRIHHAYRVLLNSKLNTTQAVEKLKAEGDQGEDVAMLIRFVEQSERGVIK
jgi:UDP-N-acetylglucosamine acyltransferase